MDDSGNARIADFGFATVTQNLDSMQSAHCQRGTLRWTAPEVLDEGPYSKEADVFSFAMVMIEVRCRLPTVRRALAHPHFVLVQVFTAAIPFFGSSTNAAMLAITQGRRPQRPTHPTFTENLWTLMQRCWDHNPHLRPEVSEALQVFLTPLVSRSFQRSYIRQPDWFLVYSEVTAWKRLISHTLTVEERISLITTIFSDDNQVETVGQLSGSDAQTFVDTIDEVSLHNLLRSRDKLIDFDTGIHILSIRCWITSHQRPAGGVGTIYT